MLKAGDEAEFTLHSNLKTGEFNAHRVRRTKEGPEPAAAGAGGGGEGEAGAEDAVPERNPNKLRLQGNLQSGEHRTQRIAKVRRGAEGRGSASYLILLTT